MRQNDIGPAPGARHKSKRVGRGTGSGHGCTACRGTKGQKSRSGYRIRRGFEGGQLPIVKRLPEQRGFTNIFRTEYATVRVDRLNLFEEESEVTPQGMLAAGLVRSLKRPVKILGDGELTKPLTVRAHRFTQTARAKIEGAGGRAEEIAAAGSPQAGEDAADS
ncbi:MAG: 50S ribosomal protein L15 [Chloroflexota bacterium]|nr:50S ribosomal protein L15 [Chloroflexota bacterium]